MEMSTIGETRATPLPLSCTPTATNCLLVAAVPGVPVIAGTRPDCIVEVSRADLDLVDPSNLTVRVCAISVLVTVFLVSRTTSDSTLTALAGIEATNRRSHSGGFVIIVFSVEVHARERIRTEQVLRLRLRQRSRRLLGRRRASAVFIRTGLPTCALGSLS